jgi:ligand-binding SRPBCC domain-containing protein
MLQCGMNFEREFRSEQLISAPIERVFEFFSLAENLERITPPILRFRILTALPIAMHAGTIIDYQIRIRGIPVLWRTLIEKWDPPHAFVDTQLKGPYKLWHHTHTFERVGKKTLMKDVVRYQAPFGVLGLLTLPVFVTPEINRIFAHRRLVIENVFPG